MVEKLKDLTNPNSLTSPSIKKKQVITVSQEVSLGPDYTYHLAADIKTANKLNDRAISPYRRYKGF